MKTIKYMLAAAFSLAMASTYAAEANDAGSASQIKYQKASAPKPAAKTQSKTQKKAKAETAEQQAPQEQSSVTTSCQVKFDEFQDNRSNKQTVGTNAIRSLSPTGLEVWLKDAEADIWLGKVKNSSGKVVTVKPKLERLYAYAQSMNLHGVMAISVDYFVEGQLIETRKYRGFGSTGNTWNAESEYYEALSYAAHDALPKVLKDINSLCEKVKS
ncbi:MAG TPA: hypothetical protein VN030_07660 [Cellvibrio sp.]|nr:hypothetical protein [Cellvibrio sp.]